MPPPDHLAGPDRPFGESPLCVTQAFMHALHHVMQAEKAGLWPRVLTRCGVTHGRSITEALDRELARLGQPMLGELPLEACVAHIEQHFTAHGWGLLTLDLSEAPTHGLVLATLERSFFVEALRDADHFTDGLVAGMLQGFFEHVSGQQLICHEISCARRGAPKCSFVIGAPEQLAPIVPLLGRSNAETILAKLRG